MTDYLDASRCPQHLESPVVVGPADDGHDAQWVCLVEGYRYVALA